MPVFSLARLVLHLMVGLVKVATLFPFLGEPARERRIQRWSRQLVAICGVTMSLDASAQEAVRRAIESGELVIDVAFLGRQQQRALDPAAPLDRAGRIDDGLAIRGNAHHIATGPFEGALDFGQSLCRWRIRQWQKPHGIVGNGVAIQAAAV